MSSWIIFVALGILSLTAYMVGRMDGARDVNNKALKQKNKADRKLKEVADEADCDIANGDTNDRMRINSWFRKQR